MQTFRGISPTGHKGTRCFLAFNVGKDNFLIQESHVKDHKKKNVEWHRDHATYALLVNLSEMSENPEGGETIVEKSNGERVALKYRAQGDAIILKGSELKHCGIDSVFINSNYFAQKFL